jgi:hypothetical protein
MVSFSNSPNFPCQMIRTARSCQVSCLRQIWPPRVIALYRPHTPHSGNEVPRMSGIPMDQIGLMIFPARTLMKPPFSSGLSQASRWVATPPRVRKAGHSTWGWWCPWNRWVLRRRTWSNRCIGHLGSPWDNQLNKLMFGGVVSLKGTKTLATQWNRLGGDKSYKQMCFMMFLCQASGSRHTVLISS